MTIEELNEQKEKLYQLVDLWRNGYRQQAVDALQKMHLELLGKDLNCNCGGKYAKYVKNIRNYIETQKRRIK